MAKTKNKKKPSRRRYTIHLADGVALEGIVGAETAVLVVQNEAIGLVYSINNHVG